MNKKNYNRRKFLKQSLLASAALSPFATLIGSLNSLKAAEINGNYKAIVCVLLEGGSDVFNMIAPRDTSAYNAYQTARESIALELTSLLPINHSNQNGLNPGNYGFRNNMTRMQSLFNANKMAIIANVGTLIQPTTLTAIENGTALPQQLFAHNTQRAQWFAGNAKGIETNGWGARVGDLFYPNPNPNPFFNVSIGGSNTLQQGGIADAIEFSDASISPDTMRTYGFGPDSGGGDLGNVYQDIFENHRLNNNKLIAALANRRIKKLNQQVELEGLFDGVQEFTGFTTGVHETGVSLGQQLELVAQILSIKDNFPENRKRQIFFVNHHGWDTHNTDNEQQVGYLSDSLGAFQDAMQQLGLENQVTTFTISDFGRSLTTNGSGTDHGWGSHAFVMGGAVNGGDIYGKMPVLSQSSDDFWQERLIPTTAMEEYLATLVKWFGANETELNTLFPNLNAFPSNDLGFMS